MNTSHLHLFITHVPVLGSLFALCLLVLGIVRPSSDVRRAALIAFVLAGLTAIPAYMTGEPAAHHLKHVVAGASDDAIEQHSELAAVALTISLVLGAISTAALIASRKTRRISRVIIAFVLLFAGVETVLLGWTANLGGRIRHTELRSEP